MAAILGASILRFNALAAIISLSNVVIFGLSNGVEAFDAISVFSPLGSALLRPGLGQTIDWNEEVGQDRRVTVVGILSRGSA